LPATRHQGSIGIALSASWTMCSCPDRTPTTAENCESTAYSVRRKEQDALIVAPTKRRSSGAGVLMRLAQRQSDARVLPCPSQSFICFGERQSPNWLEDKADFTERLDGDHASRVHECHGRHSERIASPASSAWEPVSVRPLRGVQPIWSSSVCLQLVNCVLFLTLAAGRS